MKPQVLLIFHTRYEACTAMLKGIAHHQRSNRPWVVCLDDEARAETNLDWVRSKKWDGVISRHTTPALAETCAKLKVPLIDLNDTAVLPGVLKIRPDNVAIGHLGAEYFLERKYRHFGFCGFSDMSWSRERRDGFLEALELAGHSSEVFEVAMPGNLTPTWDEKQTSALVAWLSALPSDVAIMACNDQRALQVLRAAQAAGRNVPEDIAILGANNDALMCDLADPSVSSVAVNAFQAGLQAAEHLDRMMAGESPALLDQRIEPAGIVTRKSTDIMAMRDKDVTVALNFIREHACQGITVDQVLGRVFVSRSQLEHKFRRFIGRSPQAEIRRVQVSRICQLLADTDLSLKEISEQVGYVHVEYMSVVFKRVTGETPGQYRKNTRAHELARALA